MKRILAILFALCMLTLCACSGESAGTPEVQDPVGNVTGEPQTEATTEPSTEATTEPSTEATEPSFSPEDLTQFGLPAPTFDYEYIGYCESGLVREGETEFMLYPKFVYSASADYATALAYAKEVGNSGWGEYVPASEDADPFGYVGKSDNSRVIVRWNSDETVTISVRDYTKFCEWDDTVSAYVIPGCGPYGTYGENNADLQDI